MHADSRLRQAARASWWLGMPAAILAWLLAPRPTVIYVSFEPFSIESNTLPTDFQPVLDELLAGYRVTAVALATLLIVTVVSHVRQTRAVRPLSLLLPVYVAGIEACTHLYWFGRRHNYTDPPTVAELHHELHLAATASILAVLTTLAVAGLLLKSARAGVAGRVTWRAWCAAAPLLSVVLLWAMVDRIFFGTFRL